jgi:PKD repeat protein
MKANHTKSILASTFGVRCSMFDVVLLLLSASTASTFAAVRYVDANSISPTPPYTNWSTAAVTIQDAVDVAVWGDEIVVTNGIYATGGRAMGTNLLANRVVVDKPLMVRSVNGPEFTFIEGAKAPGGGNGDGAIRCVYLADGTSLSGFTLTNGATRIAGDDERGQNGGGVFCTSTNATLTNCVMVGNSAGSGGGANRGALYGCTLTGNSAGVGGGANGSTLYRCALTGNSASWEGGGTSYGTLYNCTLSGNVAEFHGGGASCGTLYNCTLSRNSAGCGGGALLATLYNCTLTGNSAGVGGGAASGWLYNCTLTGNSASVGGGVGAYFEYGYFACELYNCIVYFNQAPNGANYSVDSYEADYITFAYSCTKPLPPGPGNIAADPQLASATHLSPNSPCIGAGSPAYAKGVDIDGEPWANPPAMGADQPGPATGPLTVSIEASLTNVATGYAVSFTAWNTGPILKSAWDFGDGTALTNQAFASHAWSAPGVYPVRLTGYNDSYPTGVTASVVVTVSEAVYYVNAASTNPVFPYASWETAARTIQDAIGAGMLPGRLVLVTNGVYRVGTVETNGLNRVALTNVVMVRSVNGPEVTVIEGETNGVRCAYVGDWSVLSGFTLRKGVAGGDWPSGNGGGAWCQPGGVVTNCVLIHNSAESQGGGAHDGTLYNCMLDGNTAYYGGGADQSTLNQCTLRNNSAVAGGGSFNSRLYNCTVTGNSGGGLWECHGNNCIVYFQAGTERANYDPFCTLNYCCTTLMPTNGVGNITNAPLFVDYAGGNLHLQANSPCINAGLNAYAPVSTDLDGNPRVVSGTVDIGAYEFQGPGSVISYAWLQQYGLPTDGSADFTDPDRDGLNNWQEWRCGTCPTNALSALRLLSASPAGSNVTVTWQSVGGVSYFLERSTNLSASPPFSLLATNLLGQPGTTSFTDTNTAGASPFFYRVGVGQ